MLRSTSDPVSLLSVTADRSDLKKLAILSPAERTRVAAYTDPARAVRFCSARIALRLALASRLNCPVNALRLEQSADGKPYISDAPHVYFSVSYEASAAFIAICVGRELGLDMQRLGPKRLKTVQDFILNAGGETHVVLDPARIWARMEAYGKMIGTGLAAGPRFLLDIALGRTHEAIPHQFLDGEANGAAVTVCVAGSAPAHFC